MRILRLLSLNKLQGLLGKRNSHIVRLLPNGGQSNVLCESAVVIAYDGHIRGNGDAEPLQLKNQRYG